MDLELKNVDWGLYGTVIPPKCWINKGVRKEKVRSIYIDFEKSFPMNNEQLLLLIWIRRKMQDSLYPSNPAYKLEGWEGIRIGIEYTHWSSIKRLCIIPNGIKLHTCVAIKLCKCRSLSLVREKITLWRNKIKSKQIPFNQMLCILDLDSSQSQVHKIWVHSSIVKVKTGNRILVRVHTY